MTRERRYGRQGHGYTSKFSNKSRQENILESDADAPGEPSPESVAEAYLQALQRIDLKSISLFSRYHGGRMAESRLSYPSQLFLKSGASFTVGISHGSRYAIVPWSGTSQYRYEPTVVTKSLVLGKVSDDGQHALNVERFADFLLELKILSHRPIYNHRNIVDIIDIGWEPKGQDSVQFPFLVLEFANVGTLEDLQKDLCIPSITKLEISVNVGNGLRALHECGIAHRDIKSSNILIFRTESGYVAKLSDFGSAFIYGNPDDSSLPHTPPWGAPELREEIKPTTLLDFIKTDIYSFALLLAKICLNGENFFARLLNVPSESLDDPAVERRILSLKQDKYDILLHNLVDLLMSTDTGITEVHKVAVQHVLSAALRSSPLHRAYSIESAIQPLTVIIDRPAQSVDSQHGISGYIPKNSFNIYDGEISVHLRSLMTNVPPQFCKTIIHHIEHISDWHPERRHKSRASLILAIYHLQQFNKDCSDTLGLKFLRNAASGGDFIAQCIYHRTCCALKPNYCADDEVTQWLIEGMRCGSEIASQGLLEVNSTIYTYNKTQIQQNLAKEEAQDSSSDDVSKNRDTTSITPLHFFAVSLHQSTESIEKLLREGTYVDPMTEQEPGGFLLIPKQYPFFDFLSPRCISGTPLHWAVASDNIEAARLFLKYGADPLAKNGSESTPFGLAVRTFKLSLIELMMPHVNKSPLSDNFESSFTAHLLASCRDRLYMILHGGVHYAEKVVRIVEILTQLDTGMEKATLVAALQSKLPLSAIKQLLAKTDDLHLAKLSGILEEVALRTDMYEVCDMLLEAGIDPNCRTGGGQSWLSALVMLENTTDSDALSKTIGLLVRYGADPTLADEEEHLQYRNLEGAQEVMLLNDNTTPLYWAVHANKPIAAKLLIHYYVDLELLRKPFHAALESRFADSFVIVETFLTHSAGGLAVLNHKDGHNRNALHILCNKDRLRCDPLVYWRKLKAVLNIMSKLDPTNASLVSLLSKRDKGGNTPLHLAVQSRNYDALSSILVTAQDLVNVKDNFGNTLLDEAQTQISAQCQAKYFQLLAADSVQSSDGENTMRWAIQQEGFAKGLQSRYDDELGPIIQFLEDRGGHRTEKALQGLVSNADDLLRSLGFDDLIFSPSIYHEDNF